MTGLTPRSESSRWRARRVPPPRSAAAALALVALAASPSAAADPEALLRQIRSGRLEPERAVALRNVEIELGLARLRVERGVLIPTRPVDGRTVELVLVGQAQFRVEPPDGIEASQLELFTGQRSLDVAVEESVLVLVDPNAVARLLERPAPRELREATVEHAEAVYREWLAGTERRRAGVETGVFRALVADPAFAGYFATWCRSHEVGEFFYQFDPTDVEQLTLARFTALDVRGWERRRLARHIRIQQRKGRFLGVRLADLGAWDIWLSATWSGAGQEPVPGDVGFESRHYDLDVTVTRGSRRLEARARLSLEATADRQRVVSLELYRDLVVRRVADGEGRPLFFFRSGSELVALLHEPSRRGQRLTLEIDYDGRALNWVGRGVFDLADTDEWYPHCGSIDRATYDVRIRWPHRLRMLAAGSLVDSGRVGKYRWQRRRIDSPAIAFSFVIGEFDVVRRQVGDVALTLAFSSAGSAGAREQTTDTVVRALQFLEGIFGPYPQNELIVVALPRGYSQSYLGFVTLTDSVLQTAGSQPGSLGSWRRDTVIAHELAHQWWGNLVGWWSYRDQWLSEAMANYAGLLFYAAAREDDDDDPLTALSVGWRDSLELVLASGRTVESLGPVVLGNRLNSSEASNGYRAIVYRKGAVVLAMLARAVGEDRFLEMMRALLHNAGGRVLTTEHFLAALERMSGLDLDGFARQYVYGTGVPLVYYEYRVEPGASAGWVLRGEARRRAPEQWEHRIVRSEEGRWELIAERRVAAWAESTTLMVPFRMSVESGPSAPNGRAAAAGAAQRGSRHGQLLLHGLQEAFEVATDERPLELRLDPRGEILARFVSAESDPKRFWRFRAEDLLLLGRADEAQELLERALRAPASEDPGPYALAWLRDPEKEARVEDLRIRLTRARIWLDQDREQAAEHELRQLDEAAAIEETPLVVEREVLWARLELRRGDTDAAFRRLKRSLRSVAPRRTRESRLRAVPADFRVGLRVLAESYGLLAIAAAGTGNREEYAWALAAARERGVDVSLLESAVPSEAPR